MIMVYKLFDINTYVTVTVLINNKLIINRNITVIM